MKNISLLLNAMLIFLLVYFGCNGKLFCNDEGEIDKSGYCAAKSCDTYNPLQKYGMISFATAQMLAQNYAASVGKKFIFNGALQTDEQDALNIWFDLKVMKNFIAFVESNACKAKCDTSAKLGVRIYYGKYPDSSILHSFADLKDVPNKYGNHHTLFMMPTFFDKASGKHLDFDPMQATADCGFKPFNDSYTMSAYGISIKKNISGNLYDKARRSRLNDSLQKRKDDVKPQDPKTFFIFGANIHPIMYSTTPGSGEQQNHGDVAPPPKDAGLFPETAE